MKKQYKFSVIMPSYNNSQFMKQALESVINQTYKNLEIIVINDGSESSHSEKIDKIVLSYEDDRIFYIKNKKNLSKSVSLNIGLDFSSGDYLNYHDNDDVSNLNRFEILNNFIQTFERAPSLVTSSGERFSTDVNKRWKGSYVKNNVEDTPENIKNKIFQENKIIGAACCWHRRVFEKIGYFDPEMLITQDYNYWMRALSLFEIEFCKENLYYFRDNPHSVRRQKNIRNMRTSSNWIRLCRDRAKNNLTIKNSSYKRDDYKIIKEAKK